MTLTLTRQKLRRTPLTRAVRRGLLGGNIARCRQRLAFMSLTATEERPS